MPVTLGELLRDRAITGVISRIATPLSLFQTYFGMGLTDAPTIQSLNRTVSWDIFDATRSVAGGSAPGTGPTRVTRQKIGQQHAACMRMHESVMLLDEEIFRTRPLGRPVGTIDQNGANYVMRQIRFMTERYRNLREFMVSRLFYGGFGLSISGQQYRPVEKGAGDVDVATQTPAAHFSQLALGSGGANLIDAAWSNANTDIAKQLNNISAAMHRVSGYPLRHIWINTNTYNYLLNNSKLQSQGGSVFRPFDSMNARDLRSVEGIPDNGFDVVFRAIPLYRFHVYDGVLNLTESTRDSTDIANVTKLIKDDTAIMHPDKGDWLGWAAGAEPVRKNLTDGGSVVQGFGAWATPTIDPAGQELKFLDNGLPFLAIPKAIMTPTIAGF